MAEGARASAGPSHEEQSQSLEQLLDNSGLDTEFWTKKLKTLLGTCIDIISQVKHLGPRELEILCKETRYTWEQTALYEFAHVDINNSKNENENLKKKAQDAVKDLKDYPLVSQNEIKDLEEMDNKFGTLLKPKDWKYSDDSKPIREQLRVDEYFKEKLKSDTDENTVKNTPHDLCALVQTASGGVALCGRSYDENEKKYSKVHRQVIQPPTDVVLKQPILPSEERTFELESRKQADVFNVFLQKMGGVLSLIQSVTDVNGEITSQKQSTKNSREKFFSRIHCQWIPTGAIQFNPNTLKLSEEALKALKNIELKIKIKGYDENVRSACRDFFAKFGTRVYVGIFHLGGEYTLEATYDSNTTQSMEEIKSLVAIKSNLACLHGIAASLALKATGVTNKWHAQY